MDTYFNQHADNTPDTHVDALTIKQDLYAACLKIEAKSTLLPTKESTGYRDDLAQDSNGLSPQSANLQRANQAYARQLYDCMKFQCQQSAGQGGHTAIGQIVRQFEFLGPTQEERQKHFTDDEKLHPAFANELDAPRRLLHQVKQAVDGHNSFDGSVNPESQRQVEKEFTTFTVYPHESALDAQRRYYALQQRLPAAIRNGHNVEYSLNAFFRAFPKGYLLAEQAKIPCEREL